MYNYLNEIYLQFLNSIMDNSVSLGAKYVGSNHVQLHFFRYISSYSSVHSSFFIYFKYGYFNIKLAYVNDP